MIRLVVSWLCLSVVVGPLAGWVVWAIGDRGVSGPMTDNEAAWFTEHREVGG